MSLSGDETQTILAAANDPEHQAALLVAHHGLALGSVCMALLGSQREAEEALQETLAAALVELPQLREPSTLRTWLLGIARRRCARRLELRAKASPLRQEPNGAPREALPARARRLLAELRPTEREALVLRYAGELPLREVGLACGIDEMAAQDRVSRGLARLRVLFGEDGK